MGVIGELSEAILVRSRLASPRTRLVGDLLRPKLLPVLVPPLLTLGWGSDSSPSGTGAGKE